MSEQKKPHYEVRIPRHEILPQVVIMETGFDKVDIEGDIIVYFVSAVPGIVVQTHPGVIVRKIK